MVGTEVPRVDKERRFEPAEVGTVLRDLVAAAPTPVPVYGT